MEWVKKAFWFLIFILVIAWLVWFFGKSANTQSVPQKTQKETARATTSLFSKNWLSGGFLTISTTTTEDEATSFFKDNVSIRNVLAAKESDPNREFVEIEASPWNKDTVVVTGWSLKTPAGKTIKIGGAANIPKQGAINQETLIALEPGDRLVVATGRSPIGVSFRENICSGYLEQFQDFSPPINTPCPSATLDLSKRNLAGDASCGSFAARIDICETPFTGFPGDISNACILYAENDLTYNGCVALHQNERFFFTDTWRFYAGENKEIWNNKGGVVRLYDGSGSLVDSLAY